MGQAAAAAGPASQAVAGQAVAAATSAAAPVLATACPVAVGGGGGVGGCTLGVEVHVFGIVPDVRVRSRFGYVAAESVVQPRLQQGPVRAADGSARAFTVSVGQLVHLSFVFGAAGRCLGSDALGTREWVQQAGAAAGADTALDRLNPFADATTPHASTSLRQTRTSCHTVDRHTHLGPFPTAPPLPPGNPLRSCVVLLRPGVAAALAATHHQHHALRSVCCALQHPTSNICLGFVLRGSTKS